MGARLRLVINTLGIVLALTLLGILLLVSSGGDDRQQRVIDHTLRELRELATAMQSEAVTADGLELDPSDRLRALELAFENAIRVLDGQADALIRGEDGLLRRAREASLSLFNILDRSGQERLHTGALSERLTTVADAARTLNDEVRSFSAEQRDYLSDRDKTIEAGRELVRQLRQRGLDASADTTFAGLQQAEDRIRRTVGSDAGPVTATLQRLREVTIPAAPLREERTNLVDRLDALLAKRIGISSSLGRIAASTLPERIEELRESVTRDHLYVLRSVSDARVLVNVYTLMLVLILVYFGVRLQRSNRWLNRSHALLEERVRERTRELQDAYEELKESQVQLVQAEKMSSLGQLVAGVVHEINTPLLYVMNNTEMTRESVEEIRRQIEPMLDALRPSIDIDALTENLDEVSALTTDSAGGLNDIDTLVKSLKDFSRLDRATYDRFDLRDGIEKTLTITRNLLKYGIEVERDLREVPEILCAPSRVNQVFINLITNAAQAMEGKGVLRISTYADRDGWVHVEIRDTGCGIPEENLNKVLDPFFTTKPVGQGTGLGLSIVRKIMDEHGGKLTIDSRVGVGTQITLSFPVDGAGEFGRNDPAAEAA